MQRMIFAFIAAAAIAMLLAPVFIPMLRRLKFGQVERKDGSYVLALFNRDDEKEMYIDFASLGIYDEMKIRDLWSHQDEGSGREIKAIVPRHGVKVVQLTK